tara:strand:- start:82 stop:396 length:315 start_codon:yes stop_codon:yes gene_type:complete
MKFTISWLKEHLETKALNEEIINKLTAIGLEVEEVQDASALYGDFLIAQVVDEEKHPNADKLKLCKVDIGGKVGCRLWSTKCSKGHEGSLCTTRCSYTHQSNET